MKIIDAHIHLDQYEDHEIESMLEGSDWIEAVVSVSNNLASCQRNLALSKTCPKVKPAFGFHPEQTLPTENELISLIDWMSQHSTDMIAVGEVGLPYYLRKEHNVPSLQYGRYLEFLETFIKLAKKWDKPIALHAVYEDAPVVCDLLEKHSMAKAHFHWFKGDEKTMARMAENGYYISVTPEVVYREKIQKLAHAYPLEQMMIETDGPWPFAGPFSEKRTHPRMMKKSIDRIAKIKNLSVTEVADNLLRNAKTFYQV